MGILESLDESIKERDAKIARGEILKEPSPEYPTVKNKNPIVIRVDTETYKTIHSVKNMLGVSLRQLCEEALYQFFVQNSNEVDTAWRMRHLNAKITREQHQLFFVQNFYKRLVMQVSFRLRMRAECEHVIALHIIEQAEQYYKLLPQNIRELVLPDLKFIMQFKEPRYFESWCESKLPDEVKYEAAKKKLLR